MMETFLACTGQWRMKFASFGDFCICTAVQHHYLSSLLFLRTRISAASYYSCVLTRAQVEAQDQATALFLTDKTS